MKRLLLIVALCGIPLAQTLQAGDGVTLESVGARVGSVIAKFFPEERVERRHRDGRLSISYATMPFQVHAVDKTGKIAKLPHEEIGPKANGFLIQLTRQNGPYGGAAAFPRTFRRPYWKTFGTQIPVDENRNHIHVLFSYGSRVPDDFVAAMIQVFESGDGRQARR